MQTLLLIFCIRKPKFPAKLQVLILLLAEFSTWYKPELNGSTKTVIIKEKKKKKKKKAKSNHINSNLDLANIEQLERLM